MFEGGGKGEGWVCVFYFVLIISGFFWIWLWFLEKSGEDGGVVGVLGVSVWVFLRRGGV